MLNGLVVAKRTLLVGLDEHLPLLFLLHLDHQFPRRLLLAHRLQRGAMLVHLRLSCILLLLLFDKGALVPVFGGEDLLCARMRHLDALGRAHRLHLKAADAVGERLAVILSLEARALGVHHRRRHERMLVLHQLPASRRHQLVLEAGWREVHDCQVEEKGSPAKAYRSVTPRHDQKVAER